MDEKKSDSKVSCEICPLDMVVTKIANLFKRK